MSLPLHDQFYQALNRTRRPLIVLKAMATVDDFAAAYAIAALLGRLDKPADIATSGGRAPESLAFLPESRPVKGDLPNIRALAITVDASRAALDELVYAVEGNAITITITPKSGAWTAADVRVAPEAYRYDLIITIGAPDLASIGNLAQTYADFFSATPIINIDHVPGNEHFGHINVVDISASSVSEVCFGLLRSVDESLVDPHIATCFLAGMISQTKSFRSNAVTTKTLEAAASLIAKGARRDDIVERLYRTRSVETLRLWGRALARLKSDAERGLVWTLLTRQDFVTAGADENALRDIVGELLSTSPASRVVAIFFETHDGSINVFLHAERPHDALRLGAPFRAVGTREAARLAPLEHDIVAAERAVITHLEHELKIERRKANIG